MSETDQTDSLWPDGLELGDRLEFDGAEYEVVGTGPAEATLERVGDDDVTLGAFRWGITDAVGITLDTSVSQDEFGALVTTNCGQSAENGGNDDE